jgi:NhaP-type Na+/H+ or K+/H+ antiporter
VAASYSFPSSTPEIASSSLLLMMLLAIVASGLLVRIFLFPLPFAITQVAVGAALSSMVRFKVDLEPNVFISLVYSAAAFFDGWRIPKGSFFCDFV